MPDTHDTREQKPKPASERPQPAAKKVKKVPRARPVKGEIDYAELSREHIGRYPKIRAALAK